MAFTAKKIASNLKENLSQVYVWTEKQEKKTKKRNQIRITSNSIIT